MNLYEKMDQAVRDAKVCMMIDGGYDFRDVASFYGLSDAGVLKLYSEHVDRYKDRPKRFAEIKDEALQIAATANSISEYDIKLGRQDD